MIKLGFHDVHGRNIKLGKQGRLAKRTESFQHGVVFSNRPIRPYEVFEIEVKEMERGWLGSLCLGLTTMSPNTMKKPLPPCVASYIYGYDDVSGTWCVLTSDGVIGSEEGLTWKSQTHLEICKSARGGCRLGVMCDTIGQMYCLENGETLVVSDRLPARTELYAIVDVYGKAKTVQIVDRNVFSLKEWCRLAVRVCVSGKDVNKLPLPSALKQYVNFGQGPLRDPVEVESVRRSPSTLSNRKA
jgi:hypothetical protein